MKWIKKLLLCLALALSLVSLGQFTVYADGVGDTGDTDQGNITGGNTYTFYYYYDRSSDSIQLTVKTKNPIKGFGNTKSHTFSSPSDSTTLNTSHPILGSSLDNAISSMISQGGYDLTVAEVKTALNGLGYSDNGNGIWKNSGGYLTYVSCVKIRKKTHTVKYDANGGSGAPSSQTKKEGTTLTLRSGKPTRTGYTFKYWVASISGHYNPGGSYTHDQDGGTVTMKAHWVDETDPSAAISAIPNSWSAGNGTVTITGQDSGSGLASYTLQRYSYVTSQWSTVKTWSFSGTTSSTTKTYTETDEGVFKYKVTIADQAGNSKSASSDKIYLDHSEPVISGAENTLSSWTKVAPTISVSATDYLVGTTYTGSGLKSLVIKDSNGTVVGRGTSSASYVLSSAYQGVRIWTVVATDNVDHQSTKIITTRYDATAPSGSITAVPNNWSAGNGTVTINVQDSGSGLSSIVLQRYSYVLGTWSNIQTWNYNGTTSIVTKTYTETSEGVFLYKVTFADAVGNVSAASSAVIYLDHSAPVISGEGNTVTTWTSTAPVISVSATDYLIGTTYTGSGMKSLVIMDGNGNIVKSGTSSARYTLGSQYQGICNWTIVATDNVGHVTTRTLTTRYDATPPNCSEFSAVPNNWSAGNGTVKFTVQDPWSGMSSVVLERYSYVTRTWTTVKTWYYSGQTSAVSGTYTETSEGVFYYRLTAKDTLGNTLVKTSAAIYLDHSNPVIYGLGSVVRDWTNIAPVISITTSDYLYGTTYTGSGVISAVIKDDAGITVASGTTSASYTLQAKYEGIHTWYVTIKDAVGHVSTGSVTTKYDITKPGVDGTEITFVRPDGVTVSGYCQDNIINQHIDDESVRSVNNPNCTSGLYSVMLYKVKNNVKTAIYSSTTNKSWGSSNTHSSFDVYYDINATDDMVDYYLVVVKDFAGNITTKKLTSQRSLLMLFHTSIDRSSYE